MKVNMDIKGIEEIKAKVLEDLWDRERARNAKVSFLSTEDIARKNGVTPRFVSVIEADRIHTEVWWFDDWMKAAVKVRVPGHYDEQGHRIGGPIV